MTKMERGQVLLKVRRVKSARLRVEWSARCAGSARRSAP